VASTEGTIASGQPSVTTVEQRGIEHIPQGQRWGRPRGLFWMWAGAVWNVEFVVYGALAVVVFGLSFAQAVLIILIGNLFYVLTGLASLQGPQAGTTAFAISRAPFGPNGNRMPSLFNWVTQVGFEIEGIALIVFAAILLTSKAGFTAGTAAKVIFIILAVAIQAVLPWLGHAAVLKVLRWLAIPFVVLFAVMAALTTSKVNLHVPAHGASWGALTIFLALVISAGGLGWSENGNDYSRYLPRSTPRMRTFWAATLGGAIPSILLELLGACAYVVSPHVTEVTGLPSSFSSWFFWPFLILALPQLFAINTLDLYSSGVTLQALGVPVKRVGAVVIDTIVAGGVTALVIFKGSFYNDLSGFLDYIVVWLGPWFGIVVTDWLLRRGRYDPLSLADESGGLYWRNGGFNWKALLALAVGMAAAMMWIDAAYYQPAYVGPLSSRTGGSDLSWLLGIVVGAVVYAVLATVSVKEERALTPAPG
jgi:nucleobase:cation symporter-1, NCS1 family